LKENTRKRTLGFVTDWIEQRYQASIYRGIVDVIKSRKINLISYVIGSLNEPYEFIAQRNVIADLINPAKLDGLIVMSGALSNYVEYNELIAFLDKYHPLPMVSVGLRLENMPNILIDNKKGMREIITHLIELHGLRRIAFIRGPSGHQEADARFQIYKDVLAENRISFNPDLILEGDFYWTSGSKAMHELLNNRKLRPKTDFQAVVASNDFMALSALEYLLDQGIRVPEDVAVTGFDNIEQTALISPPLTTVAQPLYQIGRHAADQMMDVLDGHNDSADTILPTELMTRRSCGCRFASTMQIQNFPGESYNKKNERLSSLKKNIVAELNNLLQFKEYGLESDWAVHLLNAYLSDVRQGSQNTMIPLLEHLLQKMPLFESRIRIWHRIITVVYQRTLPELKDSPQARTRADNLFQQAHILIDESHMQLMSQRVFEAERNSVQLSQFNAALIMSFEIPVLIEVIARQLQLMNIRSCFLVLYDKSSKKAPSEWSRLILAYDDYKRKDLDKAGIRFSSNQLLPNQILSDDTTYSLAVFPLFVREQQLGYILFEVERDVPRIYETIRYQISSALKGAMVFHDRQKTSDELMRSNEELEQFAYIASHDLQEPLRVISSFAQLLDRRLKGKLDDDTKTFLFHLIDGTQRMQTMIDDLLIYSRVGNRALVSRLSDLNDIVHQVQANLSFTIREKKARIQIDDLPKIICDPIQIERCLQNIISNALKYCSREPRIRISAEHKDRQWQISVQDNGIGIELENLNEIFGIFKRLHSRNKYSGTGIGLSICKKIVERHGGNIWVTSKPGEGSIFYFTIPDNTDG